MTRAITASNVLPDSPQLMRAPGQYAWRLAPRPLGPRGAPPSPQGLPALMSRSSWASERCALAPRRTPRSPRTARGTGTAGELSPSIHSNPVKPVPRDAAAAAAQRLSSWRICAHCETISEPRRRRWRQRRPSTNRWPSRRDRPSASMRRQAQWMEPCCLCGGMYAVGCMLHAGCGPDTERLNAADAAWAVAGWGRGSHCFTKTNL